MDLLAVREKLSVAQGTVHYELAQLDAQIDAAIAETQRIAEGLSWSLEQAVGHVHRLEVYI